ncbi:diacylglycerol/lipid kinase family protein [Singulisphaera sp. PoT]|uniref:diacylglycerol/lipid kinase family protein n=1 Tax=Singulisphaera sp. PoT TaxID=3411797 RepID=UPI003BF60F60
MNPVAGSCTAEDVRQALQRQFTDSEITWDIYETAKGDSLADLVREAAGKGYDLIVAAGGDGTVSAVANGLVGTETPLGIIPLGTANVLARELGIPVDLLGACELLGDPKCVAEIDAMCVEGHCYFTQVGVGIDSMMIRDTKREDKRRYGRIAYLWTASTRLIGFQPRRFELEVDDKRIRQRASQVVIANSGILGQPPFRWGPDIHPDDGLLDVCVVRARNLWNYFTLALLVIVGRHTMSTNTRYLKAQRRISIASEQPLPVQADGEIIGETPTVVEVKPHALRVLVPEPDVEVGALETQASQGS